MPSTVAAVGRELSGAPHTGHAGLAGGEGRIRKRAVRCAPLVEPVVAVFPLPPRLAAILGRLRVHIDTGESQIALQYSVHACPRRMRREIGLVFPDVIGREGELLILPTFQKTRSSMVSYQAETQAEKDAKLHLFYRWGAELVAGLRKRGYWADVTDPMSGMALFTTCGPSLYPDVEGAEILLRYTPFNLGNCFVLSHPHWGTHIYPATAFTLAPAGVVAEVLDEMLRT
ncbi:hypothetical protein LPJ61_001740 [Coemansia biformis]|uniref:Methylmalonic aciduria and homocystinuria type D protein n=1 Tax=Coemansia biformis TaxID=1286918 RepID=A0A9W7YH43_9FUNG|nr:hypothetical protein LPJ61_001740 [Coemansia biformis]